MADWYKFGLEWIGRVPSEEDLKKINEELHEIDYDTPKITLEPMYDVNWRSPICYNPGPIEVLFNIINKYNYRCRTYLHQDRGFWKHVIEADWKYSYNYQLTVDDIKDMIHKFGFKDIEELKKAVDRKYGELYEKLPET